MKLKKFKIMSGVGVGENSNIGKRNDSLKKSTSVISNGSSNKDNKETIRMKKVESSGSGQKLIL